MPTVLDVFSGDAFSVRALTEAINRIPFVPSRMAQLINWNEAGIPTTNFMLDIRDGVLTIVPPSPRGGPGQSIAKTRANSRILAVPHYQRDDAVYADEVQNVREFGQEQTLKTVLNYVTERMAVHTTDFDLTLEFQRVGAVKGIVMNPDGSTLVNLFTELGVTPQPEFAFDLGNASPGSGALRKQCTAVVRAMANKLGGAPFTSIHAVTGDAFFDALISNVEVVKSYLNTPMAAVLRDGYIEPDGNAIYGAFEFGGIVWENYRGSLGATAMIEPDEAYFFPVGPNLFRTVYAPADYVQTVNTIGLPRYAQQYAMQNGKGIHLEMQMNALSYCTRPESLMKGRAGA